MRLWQLPCLLLVLALAYGCNGEGFSATAPELLDGTWEYYPGAFLSGTDFETPESKAILERTGFFDHFRRSGFREVWSDGYGHGTLRYVAKRSDLPAEPLFLRIPYFDMAVSVMAQGKELYRNGHIGTDAASSNPVSYYPLLVGIPETGGTRLEIVIHFSNYDYSHGGIRDFLVLGTLASMQRFVESQLVVEIAIISALALLSLVLGISLYYSPGDRSSLYLLLLCFSSALIMLVNGSSQFGRLGMTWDWINRVHYANAGLSVVFLHLFFESQYENKKRDIFGIVVVTLGILELAAVLLLPVSLYGRMNSLHVLTLLAIFIRAYIHSVSRLKERQALYGMQLFALVMLTVFYFGEQLDLLMINQFNYASPVGIVVFALIQIVITIMKIRQLTAGLEAQVADRTRELTAERDQIEERIKVAIHENREKDDLIIIQARQAVMGELFDFIAHQWKQSLYAISLYAGTLRNLVAGTRSPHDADIALSLDSIDGALRHTVDTITDFRDFMNPRKDAHTFTPRQPVEETLSMLADMLSVNRIDVETALDGDYCISGTSNEFKQVLINLIVNAKDAIFRTPDLRGKIRISLSADDQRVIVRVSDNGGGIPAEIFSTIFEKYITDKADGEGLGLYLAHMIVERRFGGELLAENTGEGAAFSIILPRVEERREKDRPL